MHGSFKADPRVSPADIERLCAHSPALRAFVAMVQRNPDRVADARFPGVFLRLLTEVRLDLRVATDLPAGVREPRNEGEALAFMRAPNFVKSTHMDQLQYHVSQSGTDPRVIVTVERLVDDAGKLGVPLWPSLLHVPVLQQDAWYVQGETDLPGGESPFNWGKCCQIGHGVYRHLPWACWDAIDAMVERAGAATGYRLERLGQVPGEYRMRDDAPELADADAFRMARRRGRSPETQREEADKLLDFYSGGDWVDEHGEVHAGAGPDPRCVDRYGKVHDTQAEAEASDLSWTKPKPEGSS